MKKAVCFGEVLWDIFPEGKSAGGAPMNVAFRLKDLGFQVEMMSRIGQDSHGEELGEIIDQKLGIGYIQTDKKYPTGIVKIGLDQNKNAQYDIVYPSSWDFIEYEDSWKRLVEESDVFVFGSLACRGRKTRSTLFRLLNSSKFSVFDINLRAPHYEVDCVLDLMKKSHLVKMNEEELTLLVKHFGYEISDPEKMVRRMAKVCGLKIFCVTLGEKGALLLKGKQIHKHEGYCVEVEDTVGAGDNFLAGMIYKYLLKRKGSEILEFACAAGALAATKKGSPPNISKQNIDDFIEQNKV